MGGARRCLCLLVVALAARSAVLVATVAGRTEEQIRCMFGDTPTYVWPAVSLLELGTFRERPCPAAPPMHVRPPGYPLFLAAHYALFGFRQFPVLITQVALGAATALVVYALARQWLFDERLALLVGALASLAPGSVAAVSLVLSDLLGYVLFALGLLAFTWGIRRQRRAPLPLAAALWGASCLVHPRLLLWPAASLVLGALLARRFRCRVPWAGLLAAAAVSCVFPLGWAIRNYRQVGVFHVSTTGSYNLKYHLAADLLCWSDWRKAKPLRDKWRAEDGALREQGWSIAQISRKRFRDGWAIVCANPCLAIRAYLYSALQYLVAPGPRSMWFLPFQPRQRYRVRRVWCGVVRVGAVIGLLGLIALWRLDRWLALSLVVVLGYFIGIAAVGSRQSGRMVLHAEPAYLMLLAAGLRVMPRPLRRLRRTRAAPREPRERRP